MKKSRNILLIIIAVFALLASFVTIFSLVLNMFDILKVYGVELKQAGIDTLVYYAVELVFACLEISFGINLIKEVKKNDYFECYKQTSGLIGAITLPLFLNIIIEIVFAFVFKTPIESFDITLLVLFFLVMTLTSFIRPLILRRALKALDVIMLISSILTISIFAINYQSYFALVDEVLFDTISNAINCVMLSFLVIFSFVSLVIYSKDPELEFIESRTNEDVDVIESKENYEKVKIYSYRGVDNKKSKNSKVIGVIGCLFGMAFSVLFFIENGFHINLKDNINEFINYFSFSNSSGLYNIFDYFVKVFFPLLAFAYSINYLIGIILNNPQYKIYSMYLTRIGSSLLTILFYGRIFTILPVVFNRNFDFSVLNIFDAILVVTYIANSIANRTFKHSIKKVEDGMKHTDTYHEHIGRLVPINITYGIISIACLLLYSANNFLTNEVIYFSSILLSVGIILIICSCVIEHKNPISEYVVVKRKRVSFKIMKNKQD